MAILGPKPWVNPFGKISIFRLFKLHVFIAFLFPSLYCLKKKWKNGHFWTKTTGQTLWKNVNFSTFWTSCLYSLDRRFFVLEYRKRHFARLYCLKTKGGKKNIFGPKQWVNRFGKMSICRLFELLVFIA